MNSKTVDKLGEAFLGLLFAAMIIFTLVATVTFVLHLINHDPVRAEKERVYMAVCQSMSGVYVHSNGNIMCFKEGKLIQIDE
jgi:hypothetical protein